MSLFLVRAGKHGEHESRFLEEDRIYLTWEELNRDLSRLRSKSELREVLREVYPDAGKNKLINHSGQIWAFSHRIEKGDWVAIPSKFKSAIHIAEVTSEYNFDPKAEDPYFHYRTVRWIKQDVPRSNFSQDILYSLGAFMSICRIRRNNAEERIRAMAKTGWNPEKASAFVGGATGEADDEEETEAVDLEQLARDEIGKLLIARFKGHGLTRLVEAVLKAKGYTTFRSPEGPDKGIDLLAAPEPLGFGRPRICVQVKSGEGPTDHPTLSGLMGAMSSVQADQGLLVSWGGFKSSVSREEANVFFRVRLWDQSDLIEEILRHYNDLDETLRTELPLKRIWTVSLSDEE